MSDKPDRKILQPEDLVSGGTEDLLSKGTEVLLSGVTEESVPEDELSLANTVEQKALTQLKLVEPFHKEHIHIDAPAFLSGDSATTDELPECTCGMGSVSGLENFENGSTDGDTMCEFKGGKCAAFFEGCADKGATVCTLKIEYVADEPALKLDVSGDSENDMLDFNVLAKETTTEQLPECTCGMGSVSGLENFEQGSTDGDTMCEFKGAKCAAFFEGCAVKGATICELKIEYISDVAPSSARSIDFEMDNSPDNEILLTESTPGGLGKVIETIEDVKDGKELLKQDLKEVKKLVENIQEKMESAGAPMADNPSDAEQDLTEDDDTATDADIDALSDVQETAAAEGDTGGDRNADESTAEDNAKTAKKVANSGEERLEGAK